MDEGPPRRMSRNRGPIPVLSTLNRTRPAWTETA